MNSVVLIGRLTRDPELRYTSGTQMAVATFTVAIDRPVRAGGENRLTFRESRFSVNRLKIVKNFWQRAGW